jgi:hypothetical protein
VPCFIIVTGTHIADGLKQQIDIINAHMQLKRPHYVVDRFVVEEQRKSIESHMNSLESSLNYSSIHHFPSQYYNLESQYINKRGEKVRIEKQGYLMKQSSSLKKDWKRRWFSLLGGQLFYVRSSKDLSPVHVVNVLLCTVRNSSKTELELCFDLISPNKRVYTLQAESEAEKKDWMNTFINCAETLLTSSSEVLNTSEKHMNADKLKLHLDNKEQLINEILSANPICADCSSASPDWASINLGILICVNCSGAHRNLGVHISKVRSLHLDSLNSDVLLLIKAIGNEQFNQIYQASLPAQYHKPHQSTPASEREEFINLKYSKRAFFSKEILATATNPKQQLEQFHEATKQNNIVEMIKLLGMGVNIDEGLLNAELSSNCIQANNNAANEMTSSELSRVNDVAPSSADLNSPDSGGIEVHSPSSSASSSLLSPKSSSLQLAHLTRALHIAARYDLILAAEFLLLNNAKDALLDELARTPLQVARFYQANKVASRLNPHRK